MKILFSIALLATCIFLEAQSPRVKELSELYMSGQFDQAISKANEYLLSDPDNVDYKLILGRALADKGQYDLALPNLEFCVQNDIHNTWRKAWALGYLGTSYYILGDDEKAKNSLQSCIALNATKNSTKYAHYRMLIFGFDAYFSDWKTGETENMRFHFQNMSDRDMRSYMKSRQDAYEEVNKFFKNKLPKKIDFFAWDSREEASRVLHQNLGFANSANCVIHSHYRQTRGHEITHVISYYTDNLIRITPLINEGTAVCFNLSDSDQQKQVSDWLKSRGESFSIANLWSNWNNYPEQFSYPMAGLFVEEIIKRYGREEFLTFFTDQSYEHAKAVFGADFDDLIESFEKKYNL